MIKLDNTINIGHLLFSSISLLTVIIELWVNVNVKIAQLEFEIKTQKEKNQKMEVLYEKLITEVTKANKDVTKLLYEIKLELKDKQDRENP
jgi:hypothetical protein